jgi:transcriptional regulator with XRE-family HTH domain
MDDIHSRIKALRSKKELSMEALAGKVGVTWQTIQQWEKPNGTAPKRSRLGKVAEVLETTTTYLLMGDISKRESGDHSRVEERPPLAYLQPRQHDRQLVIKVCDIAETIDDVGLADLINIAQCLAATHPLNKAKQA